MVQRVWPAQDHWLMVKPREAQRRVFFLLGKPQGSWDQKVNAEVKSKDYGVRIDRGPALSAVSACSRVCCLISLSLSSPIYKRESMMIILPL